MNFLTNVFILGSLALVIFAPRARAQNSFNGSYKFVAKEHIKGPEYGNAVPTSLTIEVTNDSVIIQQGVIPVTMENDQPVSGPETKSRSAFANQSQPYLYRGKSSGRKYMRCVKWSDDKQSFTVTNEIYKDKNDDEIELTRIEEYTLSGDGKQLQYRVRSVETITESWEDKATYEK